MKMSAHSEGYLEYFHRVNNHGSLDWIYVDYQYLSDLLANLVCTSQSES
jgi:hypothetical protein